MNFNADNACGAYDGSKEHCWEFTDFKEGMEWYRCVDCGETTFRYQETHGG